MFADTSLSDAPLLKEVLGDGSESNKNLSKFSPG